MPVVRTHAHLRMRNNLGAAGRCLIIRGGDDIVRGGPITEIAVFEDGGHQIGEEFGGAGEGGHAEVDEFLGHGAVEAGRAFVVEGQQGDDFDAIGR